MADKQDKFITVDYLGYFEDTFKRQTEIIKTDANNVLELFETVLAKHDTSIDIRQVKFLKNGYDVKESEPISSTDHIRFIPLLP